MIHLDTNFLIAMEDPDSPATSLFRAWLAAREKFGVSAIVWTEFLCGPLSVEKVRAADALLPHKEAFLATDAPVAARLFNNSGRRRGSMADCMIAAVAIRCGAKLATLNRQDFEPFAPHSLGVVGP